jgi:hypothetical protein
MKVDWGVLRDRWHTLQRNRRLRRWFSIGVMLCTLVFLALLLIRGRQELQQFTDWRNYLGACVVGFLLYPMSLVIQAWVWSRMIARLGGARSGWWDVEIFAYSHLVQRLPGAVWYLATRSIMYTDRGVKTSATLAASGLEWLCLMGGGLLIYGLLSLPGVAPWLLGFVVVVGLWAIGHHGPRLLRALSRWQHMPTAGRQWLERMNLMNLPTAGDLTMWLAGYLLTYAVAGAIFFLLIRSVVPAAMVAYAEAMRVWALTTVATTLWVSLIPADFGPRELTITALLAPEVPVVASLFIALLIRLLFIVAAVVWGGLMWGIARFAARHASVRTS